MTPRKAIAKALSRHVWEDAELKHWVDKFVEDLREAEWPEGPGFEVLSRIPGEDY